jgi:hypothetical protein
MNNNTDPCANRFREGIEFEWIKSSNEPYKANYSCKLKTADGKFVKIKVPDDYNMVVNFLNSLPSYNEMELKKDGLYTWVLYTTDENSPVQFAAVAVKNAFEVGTAHKSIALKMGALKIHGAGELIKEGDKITYNFESGSFTIYLLETRSKNMKCTPDKMREKLIIEFEKRFPNFTLNRITKPMILKSMPVMMEDIEFYRNAGFLVEVYDTEEKCKGLSGGRRRTRKHRKHRKSSKSKRLHSLH